MQSIEPSVASGPHPCQVENFASLVARIGGIRLRSIVKASMIFPTILFSIARQSLHGTLLQLSRVSDDRKPSQARGLPSTYNFFSLKRCETRSSLPRNHRNSRDPLSNSSESAVTFEIFWNEPRQRYDSTAIHPTRAARFHRQDPL